jgi:hypothetical protein
MSIMLEGGNDARRWSVPEEKKKLLLLKFAAAGVRPNIIPGVNVIAAGEIDGVPPCCWGGVPVVAC